jgi:hypothetical protein
VIDDQFPAVETLKKKTLTFSEAWELRSGLGEMIGQARKKLASGEIDETTLGKMKKLFASVNNDIELWANKIGRPDIKDAITTANDAYKQFVVKYDVLERATAKAMGTRGAGEMFSPKRFSTALKEVAYKDKILNRFSKSEIDEMTGLANVMQVAKRAGQFKENPPTGNRWGLPTLGGTVGGAGFLAAGWEGTAAGIAAIGGAAGVARFLTGTELGKRLAISASKVEPNSAAMRAIMHTIYNQAAKIPAIVGTSGTTRDF